MLRSIYKLNTPLRLVGKNLNRSFRTSRAGSKRLGDDDLPEDLRDKLKQLGEELGYQGWRADSKPLNWNGKPASILPFSCILDSVTLTEPVQFNDEGEPLYKGEFRAHGFGETEADAFRTAVEKAILMMELQKEKKWFDALRNERSLKDKCE